MAIEETAPVPQLTTITVRPNGPLKIEGPVRLVDVDGRELSGGRPDKRGIALCRCGASADKPFCDGSHNRIGFQASAPAKGGSAV